MQKRKTKVIGVSLHPAAAAAIAQLAPSLDAQTVAEACRKMILAFLEFRGIHVTAEMLATRQKRDPVSPEIRKKLRANLQQARAARLKKLSLKQNPRPQIRHSKNAQKSTRSAA